MKNEPDLLEWVALVTMPCILLVAVIFGCKGSDLTLGVRQEPGLEHATFNDRNTGGLSTASNDGSEIYGYAELTFQLTPQEVKIINPPVQAQQPTPIEAPTGLADVAKEVVQADVWTIIALSVLSLSAGLFWYLFGRGKQ